jgi:hypothetical protein
LFSACCMQSLFPSGCPTFQAFAAMSYTK